MLKVPDGWKYKKLGELCKLSGGSGFKLKYQGFTKYDIPFYKVSDMNIKGNEITLCEANNTVNNEIICTLKAKVFPEGTLVLPKVGAALLTNKRRLLSKPSVVDNNIMAIIPHSVYKQYLYFWSLTLDLSKYVQKGALPSVNQKTLSEIDIPIPPLPEQKRIAEILSSVDEAIEATQAVIDQTQRVKQGLLQELLTKGIGHTRFKKSEIGMIPESWTVAYVDSIAKRGSGHTPSKQKPEYWNGEIKWVSLKDSSALDKLYISETVSSISEDGINNSSAVRHPAGTVVLSRDAGIGKSAITTDEMAVSQHFMAWQCSDDLDNHFFYYWLQSMKPMFERVAIGSTIKTIGLGYFKKLKIPVPPIKEQRKIGGTLTQLDLTTFKYEEEKHKLKLMKKGLMQDLLTGKVRVS